MKIIKRGELPFGTKQFSCNYCGTAFEASKGEYRSCGQLAYIHDGIEFECKCPVCGKMVYINRTVFHC